MKTQNFTTTIVVDQTPQQAFDAHTRVDDEGLPILLAAQDRPRWNKELLREGLVALRRARSLGGRGRAIAISMGAGPAAGLAELKPLELPLADYHLFYAARADMLERAGEDPRPDLEKALSLASNDGERRLLERRLRLRLHEGLARGRPS